MSGIKIGIGFGGGRLGLPSPETICAYAERAEDLGIDSIWLSDRITGLASAPRHRLRDGAVRGAHQAHQDGPERADAAGAPSGRGGAHLRDARLPHRRLRAGDHGGRPRQRSARLSRRGVPTEERGARMEEGVAVLRKLWSGPRVTHHGRFYHFDDVTIEPRPARGPLDIWIGGRTDVALRRTARYGDGWFPSFVTPEEFRAGMETARRLRRRARPHHRPARGRRRAAHLRHRRSRPRRHAAAARRRELQARPGRDGASAARSARSRRARERIQAFVDAGCTKYVLFPLAPPDELVGQIECYGRRLIPAFE